MLQSLFIQNYALIEKAQIEFTDGFTAITGETGAGKSILIGAISLVLGQRADLGAILDKEKKCIVEVEIEISKYNLDRFFELNDLDFISVTTIRREISPSGKSRAFINDTPVNLELLKDLGARLIDIHSQHQNLEVNNKNFQLDFIDSISGNYNDLKLYQSTYSKYIILQKEIEHLIAKNIQQKEKFDYIKFQFEELSKAKLKENEQEELEQEQKILSNSEVIAENIGSVLQRFRREDFSIIGELKSALNEINHISQYLSNGDEILNRLNSVKIEMEDISGEIEQLNESTLHDPNKLSKINERLNLIYHLEQKHNKSSVGELITLYKNLSKEIEEVETFEDQINGLEKQKIRLESDLNTLAQKLHKSRLANAKETAPQITNILKELGMPQAVFDIEVNKLDTIISSGISDVIFKFSSNNKIKAKEIAKIASGGELSRIMLVIKSYIAANKNLPTIIFDEIDTGISGEIATRVGAIMKKMAARLQLISITHQPQIAAIGDTQFLVYKNDNTSSLSSEIIKLTKEQRIKAIAQMISGDNPTSAAIKNAQELLSKSIV